MKKLVVFILIYCLGFSLFAEETPNKTMDRLLSLFKSYNISSIPKIIQKAEFETKILSKIRRDRQREFILQVYKEDTKGENYLLNTKLDKTVEKKILNVFHAVGFKRLTKEQIQQNETIKKEIGKIFDFDSLIFGTLKDQLPKMTQQQKDKFFNKFKALVELIAYPQGSYFYNNSEVNFEKAKINDTQAIVASTNYNIDKDLDITIAYILKNVNNNWMMVDISMNDHSLIEAYRFQINRIVKKKGIDGLLNLLDQKYEELTK